jgi:hypothetical protein
MEAFGNWCPPESQTLLARAWKWNREAKAAGLEDQFEFLYSYTSRLLHATPLGITTDQKNLEPSEIAIFMRFIHVSLIDILDITAKLRQLIED